MAIKATHKDVKFGVGDTVRVYQSITEGDKKRLQAFEGMVIAIRGEGNSKNFIVRRVGALQVGIEKIFPLSAPVVDRIEIVKKGTKGVRRAKLYYTRGISKREVEKIYRRTAKKDSASSSKAGKVKKGSKVKKTSKK